MNGIDVEEEEEDNLTDNEDCVEATEVVTEAEVDAISLCQINLIKEISIQWARNSKISSNDLLSTKSSNWLTLNIELVFLVLRVGVTS